MAAFEGPAPGPMSSSVLLLTDVVPSSDGEVVLFFFLAAVSAKVLPSPFVGFVGDWQALFASLVETDWESLCNVSSSPKVEIFAAHWGATLHAAVPVER